MSVRMLREKRRKQEGAIVKEAYKNNLQLRIQLAKSGNHYKARRWWVEEEGQMGRLRDRARDRYDQEKPWPLSMRSGTSVEPTEINLKLSRREGLRSDEASGENQMLEYLQTTHVLLSKEHGKELSPKCLEKKQDSICNVTTGGARSQLLKESLRIRRWEGVTNSEQEGPAKKKMGGVESQDAEEHGHDK